MKNERKTTPYLFYMSTMSQFSLKAQEVCFYGEAAYNCLLVITKGRIKCSLLDDLLLLKGDSILLSCEHSFQMIGEDKESQGYIIQFQKVCSDQLPENISEWGGKSIRIKPFVSFVNDLDELYNSLTETDRLKRFKAQLLFQQMMLRMIEACQFNQELGDSVLDVKRTISYIHQHYMEKLTTIQLAQQVNISIRQYTRVFKKLTGKTPINYINNYRINRSKELLLETDDTVHKISYKIGINDVHYFTRRFKQNVGCSPKEYVRLRHLNSKIVTMHYAGEMLALGVKPIGALQATLQQLQSPVSGIVSIGDVNCDVKILKELQPDIIIASDFMSKEELLKIEQLAPVIVIPWDIHPNERLLRIARVLGKAKEASAYLAQYEQNRQLVKKWCTTQFPFTQTATIIRLDEQKVWVHASRFFPIFYDVMPFSPSKLMLETTEIHTNLRRIDISFNRILEIDADRIYIVIGGEREFNRWLEELTSIKDWYKLKAVQHNQVFILRHQGISNSVYTLNWQLGEVPTLLAPSTTTASKEGLLVNILEK